MKAEELRLKNLLVNLIGDVVEVTSISETLIEYNRFISEEKGFLYDPNFEEYEDSLRTGFEPIILTEEWLLKFGFKPFSKDYSRSGVIIHTRKRGYVLKKSVPVILYVHQLQNLYFALTGQELTLTQTHNK